MDSIRTGAYISWKAETMWLGIEQGQLGNLEQYFCYFKILGGGLSLGDKMKLANQKIRLAADRIMCNTLFVICLTISY